VQLGTRLFGFGDESSSRNSVDPDVYILGAALVNETDLNIAREIAFTLRVPGKTKPHWRDESIRRHDVVVDTIVKLPLRGLVVVRRGQAAERLERQRRKCFSVFVQELEARSCGVLTMESRGKSDDKRDEIMLRSMRAQQISAQLRLEHEWGGANPMLWIADALCGAVVSARTGNARWLDQLAGMCDVIVVDER